MSTHLESSEYVEADVELVGLPEAATRLGLHRATVNAMVHAGRLPATRYGAHWFVRRPDLESFAQSYVRPPNSPWAPAKPSEPSPIRQQIVTLLTEWDEATVEELARVIDVHIGNIRKHLRFLEADGLAIRSVKGEWRLRTKCTQG